jgi:hypothetical protein
LSSNELKELLSNREGFDRLKALGGMDSRIVRTRTTERRRCPLCMPLI